MIYRPRVHDVHLNQGTPLSMKRHKTNGIYQDGALFVKNLDNPVKAFFFMFKEQSLKTDPNGNPVEQK
ncbi:DUF2278 family protein [Candidatus Cardinium sp. TP]|uniref:DUF2278 family protein n=1 Tax=Candidatus Cardinium sp. TP TaxID=2961955 RepID=UPI0030EFB094